MYKRTNIYVKRTFHISLVLLQGDVGGVFSVNISSNSNIVDGDEV